MKSTVDEIRERFDNDVERFSDLETGQSATIDAPLCLELIAEAASVVTPHAESILDIGCGAGNFTLKLLQRFEGADVTLIDLSRPMLDRAQARIGRAKAGRVRAIQGDIREVELGDHQFDVVIAAAVLHHLRSDREWSAACARVFDSLKPGGSFWVFDLISHQHAPVQDAMWQRYGQYLAGLKGEAYRDDVFAYIEKEDSPVPLMTIVDHLRLAGFTDVEVLHKHNCYAALGGVKPA
ncbi:MAG: class I SAM-dependent methyltransferase [Planctomycetota bacterium]